MKNLLKIILLPIVVVGAVAYFYYPLHHDDRSVTLAPSDWQTAHVNDYTFRYPAQLPTTYIHTVPTDWPPKLQATNNPFTCTEAGVGYMPAGKTEQHMVGDRTYCVTRETQGAAGSIYTLYAYAFPKFGKVLILTFSMRAVQCLNYEDPQKTDCQTERQTFNIDTIVDQIAQSVSRATSTSTIPPSPKPVQKGTVTGAVLLGPTCPVERIPPDPQCADKPYQTTIRIQANDLSGNPSTLFTTTQSDASGRFSVSLPTGSYTFKPVGGNHMPPTCRPQNITVIAGETQPITLSCDTGMR